MGPFSFLKIWQKYQTAGHLVNLKPWSAAGHLDTAFLTFQILFLLRALMCRISANISLANFKIDFVVNQSEYRKSLTPFCSLSATDWHCAVCLVVLATRKAGWVSLTNSVSFAFEGLRSLSIKSNLKKMISSDSTFYFLYDDIYFSMVLR